MSLAACIRRCPTTTRRPWWACSLLPTNRSSTDASASFDWRNSGSCSSRPTKRWIQARVPTLPTPTTLRAVWTYSNSSIGWWWSASERRYFWISERISFSESSVVMLRPSWTSSSIGTISGGSGDDSQLTVDLVGTLREHAHVVARSRLGDVLRCLLRLPSCRAVSPRPRCAPSPMTCSTSMWSYQASRVPRLAACRITTRYSRTPAMTMIAPVGGRETAFAAQDLDARSEALHVPFPGAGKCLVEVVDVEQDLSLGRAEEAEVRQVGIAAQLDVDARARRRRQVGGHHERRRLDRTRTATPASARSESGRAPTPGSRPAPRGARSGRAGRPPASSRRASTSVPPVWPLCRERRALPR